MGCRDNGYILEFKYSKGMAIGAILMVIIIIAAVVGAISASLSSGQERFSGQTKDIAVDSVIFSASRVVESIERDIYAGIIPADGVLFDYFGSQANFRDYGELLPPNL